MASFFQIFKGRFLCLLSSRSEKVPQTLPRLFPANANPSPPSSNQCLMTISSYMSSSLSATLWPCVFNIQPWSLPIHNSMAICQETYLPSSSQSCLYLSVIAVPCCLQSDRRGSAMNCSVINVNMRAPLESLIFNISRTWWGKNRPLEKCSKMHSNTETGHFLSFSGIRGS